MFQKKELIRSLIITFIILLIGLSNTNAQDSLVVYSAEDSLNYWQPELGVFIFPLEDVHVLGKVADELDARKDEIEMLRIEEVKWIEYRDSIQSQTKSYLKQIEGLKTSLEILEEDKLLLEGNFEDCAMILSDKDKLLTEVSASRSIWRTTAISSLTAAAGTGLWFIIKWLVKSI